MKNSPQEVQVLGSRGRSLAAVGCCALVAFGTSACDAVLGTSARSSMTADRGGLVSGDLEPGEGPGANPLGIDPKDPNAVGLFPLRRLTRLEYNNTVRDLLLTSTTPADEFPTDRDVSYTFPRAGVVSVQDARLLRDAAEALATEADVSRLLPCDESEIGAEACASEFIESFAARAYRRPLLDEERARLLELYAGVAAPPLDLVFDEAVRVLIAAILQAPAFLYRWELGPTDAAVTGQFVQLNAYELASRLSYFIWRSMPDEELFEAAASGALDDPTKLEEQARRLLGDPKAQDALPSFFEHWLGVAGLESRSKSTEAYPEFTDELKASMLAETRAFTRDVLFNRNADFATLFGSSDTFINAPLAGVYGMPNVQGVALTPASLPSEQRSGVLTQASFLAEMGAAEGSHPTRRGAAIVERVLCLVLPPVPNDVPLPAPPSAGGTTRDRFATHADNPCASACHGILDPLGFAFEHYDGIGAFRTVDNGLPVDATGTFELDDVELTFSGAVELTAQLAESRTVKQCFASQWMRYGLDREDLDLDGPSLELALQAFETNGNIFDLIVAVATSRSFRYRALALGEDQP